MQKLALLSIVLSVNISGISLLRAAEARPSVHSNNLSTEIANENLFLSVKALDIKGIETALKEGADINASRTEKITGPEGNEEYHFTPLLLAISSIDSHPKQEDVVKYLIKKGADVNSDKSLMIAVCNKNIIVAKILIANGAHIEDEEITRATNELELDILNTLLDLGGNVNAKFYNGETIFLRAFNLGKKDLVELILSKGPNVNVVDNLDRTPLMYSAACGWEDIVNKLLDMKVELGKIDHYKNTALMYASMAGRENVVKLLLSRGANLTQKNLEGESAADLAAKNNEPKIAFLLSNKTTSPQQIYSTEIEENHLAQLINNGRGVLDVLHLINKGASVNSVERLFGNTYPAIVLAADSGNDAIVELLVSKGADINARESYRGDTVLMTAAGRGNFSNKGMVEYLIAKGAQINLENKNGATALCNARLPEIIDILKKHGAIEGTNCIKEYGN